MPWQRVRAERPRASIEKGIAGDFYLTCGPPVRRSSEAVLTKLREALDKQKFRATVSGGWAAEAVETQSAKPGAPSGDAVGTARP